MKSVRQHSKTLFMHHNRSKIVSCPKCNANAGANCTRTDGKGSRPHVERVIKWENGERDS